MTSTLGVVEVPPVALRSSAGTGSSISLVNRRFSGKSLLEWVVRRVTEALLLDQVAVVTDEGQAEAVRRRTPPDAPVLVSDRPDALGRFADAARRFQATQLVRVPLSRPFVDPDLIDRLVCTAGANPGYDYIGFFSMDGRPAALSKVGLFAEWFSADAIGRADRNAKSPQDRADSTHYIYSHPEIFQLRFIPIPPRLDRSDLRLTVDLEEDWDLAQTILEALGPEGLDWHRIASLLDQQPRLRERMADLNGATVGS